MHVQQELKTLKCYLEECRCFCPLWILESRRLDTVPRWNLSQKSITRTMAKNLFKRSKCVCVSLTLTVNTNDVFFGAVCQRRGAAWRFSAPFLSFVRDIPKILLVPGTRCHDTNSFFTLTLARLRSSALFLLHIPPWISLLLLHLHPRSISVNVAPEDQETQQKPGQGDSAIHV